MTDSPETVLNRCNPETLHRPKTFLLKLKHAQTLVTPRNLHTSNLKPLSLVALRQCCQRRLQQDQGLVRNRDCKTKTVAAKGLGKSSPRASPHELLEPPNAVSFFFAPALSRHISRQTNLEGCCTLGDAMPTATERRQ